jgi:hypothetical protein
LVDQKTYDVNGKVLDPSNYDKAVKTELSVKKPGFDRKAVSKLEQ